MNSFRTLAATIAALSVCTAQANLLSNGGFESEPSFGSGVSNDSGYSLLTGSQIPGWTISANRGVTVHNSNLYPHITGTYSVNMDGEGYNGHNADFYQDFASTPGAKYQLGFNWSIWMNNYAGGFQVSVTDKATSTILSTGTYNGSTNPVSGFYSELQSFTGTGNALRLSVVESPESTFNDNKFMVDDFTVDAVPEPGTVAALGLAALALLRRRRN